MPSYSKLPSRLHNYSNSSQFCKSSFGTKIHWGVLLTTIPHFTFPSSVGLNKNFSAWRWAAWFSPHSWNSGEPTILANFCCTWVIPSAASPHNLEVVTLWWWEMWGWHSVIVPTQRERSKEGKNKFPETLCESQFMSHFCIVVILFTSMQLQQTANPILGAGCASSSSLSRWPTPAHSLCHPVTNLKQILALHIPPTCHLST